MTDSQVLEAVRAACLAGNPGGMQALLDLTPSIAALSKPSLAIAKGMIYGRFDASDVPRRLTNAAIRAEREAFLRRED